MPREPWYVYIRAATRSECIDRARKSRRGMQEDANKQVLEFDAPREEGGGYVIRIAFHYKDDCDCGQDRRNAQQASIKKPCEGV